MFETLKKRRAGVYRAVPMPQDACDTIDMVHGLQEGVTLPCGTMRASRRPAYQRVGLGFRSSKRR
ncbi:MAG: hypothetical protein P8Y27_14415, partial [Chromatiaceae bacterium]